MFRYLALRVLLCLTAVALVGCSRGESLNGFCEAFADLKRQQQSDPRSGALTSLTLNEIVDYYTEQRNASLPMLAQVPGSLRDDWVSVSAAENVAVGRILSEWPRRGSGELLVARAEAAGYGSVTEYILRDPFFVGDEAWTFRLMLEAGRDVSDRSRALCSDLNQSSGSGSS